MALATCLLLACGLMLKDLAALYRVDAGFRLDGLIRADVTVGAARYPAVAPKIELLERLERGVRSLPGVEGAAVASGSPPHLTDLRFVRFSSAEGYEGEDSSAGAFVTVVHSSPGYFDLLGLTPVEGELFGPGADGRRVVLSERLAEHLWPRRSAVGRRFGLGPGDDLVEVVGVVPDVRHAGYDEPDHRLELYVPIGGLPVWQGSFELLVDVGEDGSAVAEAIRTRIRQESPDLPIGRVSTMREAFSADLARRRFNLLVIGTLAGVGALLAALGLYGVVSYGVRSGVREIGIRMALGASPRRIFRRVVARGLVLAILGAGVGAGAGVALRGLTENVLFGVSGDDPTVVAAVVVCALLLALVATVLPARRATGVNPQETLRSD